LINLRKTILLVFELAGFSHSQGHLLPRRSVAVVAAAPPKAATLTGPGRSREGPNRDINGVSFDHLVGTKQK
jgi:hypothetical protein